MRYSIVFLGLIASTTANHDPCQTDVQCFLKPLASDPAAAKFCASKYSTRSEGVTIANSVAQPRSDNQLYKELTKAAENVASTFCKCNFPPPSNRGQSGRVKYRGRIRRSSSYDKEEAEM